MWTNENRARCDRSKLCHPSDLTDAEWALAAPLIPPARRGGNERTAVVREAVNGVMSILSTGCRWAALPGRSAARPVVPAPPKQSKTVCDTGACSWQAPPERNSSVPMRRVASWLPAPGTGGVAPAVGCSANGCGGSRPGPAAGRPTASLPLGATSTPPRVPPPSARPRPAGRSPSASTRRFAACWSACHVPGPAALCLLGYRRPAVPLPRPAPRLRRLRATEQADDGL